MKVGWEALMFGPFLHCNLADRLARCDDIEHIRQGGHIGCEMHTTHREKFHSRLRVHSGPTGSTISKGSALAMRSQSLTIVASDKLPLVDLILAASVTANTKCTH